MGPGDERELARLAAVDARPGDVARHEVRRELDALEGAAAHDGERARDERLAEARRALDEDVPLARCAATSSPSTSSCWPDDDARHLAA